MGVLGTEPGQLEVSVTGTAAALEFDSGDPWELGSMPDCPVSRDSSENPAGGFIEGITGVFCVDDAGNMGPDVEAGLGHAR